MEAPNLKLRRAMMMYSPIFPSMALELSQVLGIDEIRSMQCLSLMYSKAASQTMLKGAK